MAAAPRAFSLVELLVVAAILGALVALLLPAVQAAREGARRAACQNHLRQLGIALQLFHDQHNAFPIGCVEWRPPGAERHERQLAWCAWLLPWLEQQALFAQIDLQQAFDAPANAAAARETLAVFRCPSSRRLEPPETLRGGSDFGGIYGERITGNNYPPQGILLIDEAVAIDQVLDGTSHTLIVGEDTRHPDGQWINGRNLFDQAFAVNAAPPFENDLWSDHPGGAMGLAADGSVHFLGASLPRNVLAALCTRAGEEAVAPW